MGGATRLCGARHHPIYLCVAVPRYQGNVWDLESAKSSPAGKLHGKAKLAERGDRKLCVFGLAFSQSGVLATTNSNASDAPTLTVVRPVA